MNINELTEKAVVEQLGALVLENTKLRAANLAFQQEIARLMGVVAELEKSKLNGAGDNSHGNADEASSAT